MVIPCLRIKKLFHRLWVNENRNIFKYALPRISINYCVNSFLVWLNKVPIASTLN